MYESNKIHLGNAYELIKQIPDNSIDLIITDPPYDMANLKGGGNCIINGTLAKWSQKNCFKDLGNNNLNIGIDDKIFDEFMRVMKIPNIYIWCNSKQIYQYLNYFVGIHKLNFKLIVWNKINAMPLCGGKYLEDCEYCLYFYKGIKLNTCIVGDMLKEQPKEEIMTMTYKGITISFHHTILNKVMEVIRDVEL